MHLFKRIYHFFKHSCTSIPIPFIGMEKLDHSIINELHIKNCKNVKQCYKPSNASLYKPGDQAPREKGAAGAPHRGP